MVYDALTSGVPPFSNSLADIQLMRRAYKAIGTQEQVADSMKVWMIKEGFSLDLINKLLKQQAISLVFNEKPKPRSRSIEHRTIVWKWLHSDRGDIVRIVRTPPSEVVLARNGLARELHSFLSPGQPFAIRNLDHVTGRYALYHAYSRNVDEMIMVEELICGVNDDPECFTVASPYPAHNVVDEVVGVSGIIVPFGDRFLFQGHFTGMEGPYIFAITGKERDPRTGKLLYGEGVLLAAGGGSPASAYPLLIVRQEEKVLTGPRPIDRLGHSETDAMIRACIKRGVVRWQQTY